MSRQKNPVNEAVIFAIGTTVGIVVGTVLATWLVESLKANGQLPGGVPAPAPLPASPSSPSPSSAVVPIYIQDAGKKVSVGTHLQLLDANTGKAVDASVEGSSGVLAAGSTVGAFTAVGAGTVKLFAPDGSSTTVVVS